MEYNQMINDHTSLTCSVMVRSCGALRVSGVDSVEDEEVRE